MHRFLSCLLAVAVLLTGCSPTLNWREVRLDPGELKTLLPCKPDKGSRRVSLAGTEVEIRMLGCEAGGALYAVSVAEMATPAQTTLAQAQWQASLLANMQAEQSAISAFSIQGAGSQLTPLRLHARGHRPDGQPVAAQGVWFASGKRLYHAVIYAARMSDELSEPFFSGLELK